MHGFLLLSSLAKRLPTDCHIMWAAMMPANDKEACEQLAEKLRLQ